MSRPSPLSTSSRAALAVAALLLSLSLVAWRQGRALEALAGLEDARRERALAEAERVDLEGRVQHLESRGRVVPAARERLNMRMPEASEILFLSAEAP